MQWKLYLSTVFGGTFQTRSWLGTSVATTTTVTKINFAVYRGVTFEVSLTCIPCLNEFRCSILFNSKLGAHLGFLWDFREKDLKFLAIGDGNGPRKPLNFAFWRRFFGEGHIFIKALILRLYKIKIVLLFGIFHLKPRSGERTCDTCLRMAFFHLVEGLASDAMLGQCLPLFNMND